VVYKREHKQKIIYFIMQKKYVLSLLMAAPAAMPVLAAVNVGDVSADGGQWNLHEVTGQPAIADGNITCPLGGVLKYTFANLPKGKYILTIADAKNIKVSVNGNAPKVENGSYIFELREKGDAELSITSADPIQPSFTIGTVTLELDFNFDAAKDALQSQLDAVVIYEPKDPKADKTKYNELVDQKTAIQDEISGLAGLTGDAALKVYDDNEFFNDNEESEYTLNKIAGEITTLKTGENGVGGVEEFNKQTTASNDKYAADKYNEEQKQKRLQQITNVYQQKLNPAITKMGTEGYVFDLNNAKAEEIKVALEAHRVTINEFFAELAKEDSARKITPEEFDALDLHNLTPDPWDEALNLLDQVDKDVADLKAYNDLVNDKARLDKALAEAVTYINTLTQKVGETDAFADDRKKWTDDLNQIVADAKAALKIDQIADEARKYNGARTLYGGDLQTIEDAIAQIGDTKTNAKDTFDAANKAYTDACAVIDELTEKVKTAAEAGKDLTYKENFDDQVTEINKEIEDLKGEIDEAYINGTLSEETYKDGKANIESHIDALATMAEKYKAVGEQKKALTEAEEAIDNDFVKGRFQDNINKINSSINGILDEIGALDSTSDKYAGALKKIDSDIEEVKGAIEFLTKNAKDLTDACTTVEDALAAYEKSLKDVDALKDSQKTCDGKDLWTEFTKDGSAYKKAAKDLADQQKAYEEDAKALKDNNECFNAIIDLSNELNADEFAKTCQALTYDYCKQVVDHNKKIADKALTDYENTIKGKEGIPGYDALQTTLTERQDELTGIGNSITDKVKADSETLATDCIDINGKIKDFIDGLNADVKKAEDTITSDNNYNDLDKDLIKTDGSVQAAINAADEANKKYSVKTGAGEDDPAYVHYAEVINKLQEDFNTCVGEVEKAHNDGKLDDKAKADFVTKLGGIKGEAEALAKASAESEDLPGTIKDNSDNLTEALNEGQYVTGEINGIIAAVEKYVDGGVAGFESQKEKYIKDLNGLLGELYDINTEVVSAYGDGVMADEAELKGYKDRYNELLDKANKLYGEFDLEFGSGAVDHNNGILDGKWKPMYSKLHETYDNDVKAFDKYDKLQNPGYREYIDDLLVQYTHEGIFEYYEQIETLNKEVQDWFAEKNGIVDENGDATEWGGAKAVSEDDPKFLAFMTRAGEIIKGMNKVSSALKEAVDARAEEYYNAKKKASEDNIANAKKQLNDAGIDPATCTAVSEAENALGWAITNHDDATDIGVTMDGIADNLDKAIVTPEALLVAAKAQWAKDLENARADMDVLETELAGYDQATDKAKTAATEAIVDARESIDILEAEAIRMLTGLDAYKPLAEQLIGIYDRARAEVDKAQISHDKQTQVTDFDGFIDNLSTDLDAYKDYISDLAGDNSPSVTAVQNAIDAAKAALENYKEEDGTGSAADVQAAIDAAKAELEQAYAAAAAREKAVIEELLTRVRLAFNEAKAGADLSDPEIKADYDKKNEEIRGLEAALADYTYNPDDKDGSKKTLTDMEKALNDLEAALDAEAVNNAVAELNGLADTLSGTIGDYETEYSSDEFARQEQTTEKYGETPYKDIQEQLDALKNKWSDGNGVLTMKESYKRQIEDLTEQLDALHQQIADDNAAFKAVNDKNAASDARYTELSAELDDIQARINGLKERLTGFGITTDEDYVENMQTNLGILREWLETAKEQYALTADSNLPVDKDYYFYNYIQAIEYQATNDYLTARINEASQNIVDARGSLIPETGKRILPEVINEITAQLDTLREELNTVEAGYAAQQDSWNNEDFDYNTYLAALDGYIEDAQAIADAAKAAQAEATDSVFMAGDVTKDDVVDIIDIQSVLSWVGKNVAYKDLYDDSPRKAVAADIDNNKRINIGDATAVVSIALGDDASMVRFGMSGKTTETAGNIYAELLGEENGVRHYAINLLNSQAFVSGQFDIVLPVGAEIVEARAGERAANHNVLVFDNGDSTRILVASLENVAINGESGAVVYIDVTGSGNIKVQEAIFADRQARTYEIARADTSFLDSLRNGYNTVKEAIYNVAGQAMNRVQRGINIIRKSDGSTSKELHR